MASSAADAPSTAFDPLQIGAGGWLARVRGALETWLDAERDQLALWLPVALGGGVTSWYLLNSPRQWIAAILMMSALGLAALALGRTGRTARVVAIGALAAALGLALIWWRAERVAAPVLDRPVIARFVGRVETVDPLPARALVQLEMTPIRTLPIACARPPCDAPAVLPPRFRVNLAEANAPSGLHAGSTIELRARLMPPPDAGVPGAYDFAQTAWFAQIGATGRGFAPIRVIAAPAGPKGGVIYIFEDITARLKLESLNKALSSVQRETLNALSEGVAVFGTNGRLTLSNPRLSVLWKLPMNELGHNPHIDAIAEACARVMPEDGAIIWRDLKRRIVDLNPTRSDTTGRITRADGRLLDYAVTRLPDGQTMMTFLDVTESANYNRVLKERNDALVTADKLKDAFVQNVSYELRSPLTNIIGFADLLASNEVGMLNERQRAYTDYIRASSVTLGVLIDNILDLATVDAGIAELRPELQDVPGLVEKARAGLAATFPQISGEKPLNVVIDVPEHLPPFLADGTRIVQVLYNLLSNAARFSEPGGEIRLSVAARADRMLFIVEDEGPGMSEEMQAAMTESIETASGRQRGAGLGLAIVRSFVNLHGGTITIENRKPRGTRVIVNLPRLAAFAATGAAE